MHKRLLGVTLLLVLASNVCLGQYLLTGTLYPLRWGQQEGSAGLVTPANTLGQPLCVKAGSSFGCRLGNTSGIIGWKVSYARLRSRLGDQQIHWTVNDPGVTNLIAPGATYSLPNIPSFVDYARLEMSLVILYWGFWGPTYYLTPVYSSEEVFIVLDEPKPPMSPAWVSLLRYSCGWAHRKDNADDAAQAITFGVFFQRPGFAYPEDTASRWLDDTTFMLKALLDKWNAGTWVKGNCADVSCFTMVALCSMGLDFSVRQLTGNLAPLTPSPDPPFSTCTPQKCPVIWVNNTPLYLPHLHTNPICPIGSDPTVDRTYNWWSWAWHQVCVLTGAPDPPSNGAGIWDPTAAQREDLEGYGYRNPPAHHPSHQWLQKDYWQKAHTEVPGAWLGLVSQPTQGANNPQLLVTWKCEVSSDPWQPLP